MPPSKKQKLQSLNPQDPKEWGPLNRDRLVRAFMVHGFGEWERIRSEANAEGMPHTSKTVL